MDMKARFARRRVSVNKRTLRVELRGVCATQNVGAGGAAPNSRTFAGGLSFGVKYLRRVNPIPLYARGYARPRVPIACVWASCGQVFVDMATGGTFGNTLAIFRMSPKLTSCCGP